MVVVEAAIVFADVMFEAVLIAKEVEVMREMLRLWPGLK